MPDPLAAPFVEQLSPQKLVDSLCQLAVRSDAVVRVRAGGVPRQARDWIRRHDLLALALRPILAARAGTGHSSHPWSVRSPRWIVLWLTCCRITTWG